MAYGGANFRHWYMQQGVGQLTLFMRHWRQPTSLTGKLPKCAVAWTQMSAGTSYSIFQRVTEELPHLEAKWLTSMRTFMAQINASMELDTTGVPSLQRQHDAHIMDIILESNQFTNAQVRPLNYCRMYLQAVTISDISDATGQQLDRSKMLGKPNAKSSTTTWIQINQERPSEVEWKLWRKANLLWSNVLGELRTHLGQWLVSRPRQRQQQFAYLHRNRRLYVRMGIDQYQVCLPTGTPGEYRLHPRVRAYDAVKAMAHPVHVTASVANPDYWQVDQRMHSILPTSPTDRSTTFDEFVDTLEPWEIDVLRMATLHVNPNALCEALSSGFRAASDGSVRLMTQGSFGWVLSTDNGHQLATGMGPARGPRPASYRAEGYGLLSILQFLIRVADLPAKSNHGQASWLQTVRAS
jgi:hypothetical protein